MWRIPQWVKHNKLERKRGNTWVCVCKKDHADPPGRVTLSSCLLPDPPLLLSLSSHDNGHPTTLVWTANAGIVPAAAVVILTHIQRWQSGWQLVFFFFCMRHIKMTRSSKKMWATKLRDLTWLCGCRMTQKRRGAETRQWIKMTPQNIKVTGFFFFFLNYPSMRRGCLFMQSLLELFWFLLQSWKNRQDGAKSSLRWWLMTAASPQLEKFQNDNKRGIMKRQLCPVVIGFFFFFCSSLKALTVLDFTQQLPRWSDWNKQ